MRLPESIQMAILRDISKDIDKFFLASIVEFTSQTPQVFFDSAFVVSCSLVIQQSLAVLELICCLLFGHELLLEVSQISCSGRMADEISLHSLADSRIRQQFRFPFIAHLHIFESPSDFIDGCKQSFTIAAMTIVGRGEKLTAR